MGIRSSSASALSTSVNHPAKSSRLRTRRPSTLLPALADHVHGVRAIRWLSAAMFGRQSVALPSIDGSRNRGDASGDPLAIPCVVPSRGGGRGEVELLIRDGPCAQHGIVRLPVPRLALRGLKGGRRRKAGLAHRSVASARVFAMETHAPSDQTGFRKGVEDTVNDVFRAVCCGRPPVYTSSNEGPRSRMRRRGLSSVIYVQKPCRDTAIDRLKIGWARRAWRSAPFGCSAEPCSARRAPRCSPAREPAWCR
jgi:hypothetical protein